VAAGLLASEDCPVGLSLPLVEHPLGLLDEKQCVVVEKTPERVEVVVEGGEPGLVRDEGRARLHSLEDLPGPHRRKVHLVAGGTDTIEGAGHLFVAADHLRGGIEHGRVEGSGGELRLGVKGANPREQVAVELDAEGLWRRGREDVHQGAAHGHGAPVLDQRGLAVAGGQEATRQLIPIDLVGDLYATAVAVEGDAGDDEPGHRRRLEHEDRRGAGSPSGQPRQGCEAGHRVPPIGPEGGAGGQVVLRVADHLRPGRPVRRQLGAEVPAVRLEAPRRALVGRQSHHEAARPSGEAGQDRGGGAPSRSHEVHPTPGPENGVHHLVDGRDATCDQLWKLRIHGDGSLIAIAPARKGRRGRRSPEALPADSIGDR